MESSPEIGELAAALSKAQAAGLIALENATNSHLGSQYADLAAVWAALRAPLADNGLAITQHPGPVRFESERAIVTVTACLMHTSGQWQRSDMDVVVPLGQKGLNPAQILGLSIAYGRRYQLAALAGVVTAGEEDAESARMIPPPPPAAAAVTYAPAGKWQDYANSKWKEQPAPDHDGRTLGDLDPDELREVRRAHYSANPAIQASVADQTMDWLLDAELTYGGIPKPGPGWPEQFNALTPDQLKRLMAIVNNHLKTAAQP